MYCEPVEVGFHSIELLKRRFQAVHVVAKKRCASKSPDIPADVLPRDAHAALFAVKLVERTQMIQQYFSNFHDLRRRQVVPASQVVPNFAKYPWPPLRRTADHQTIGTSQVQHLTSFFRGIDVAVRNNRDSDARFHFGDSFVFGLTTKGTSASAPMNRQCRHPS